jgi:hypothetical protein
VSAIQSAMFGLPDYDATAPRAMYRCERVRDHANGRARHFSGSPGTAPCPECGRVTFGTTIRGTYHKDALCNSLCVAATGPDCECNCAGANHGKAWLLR